MASGAAIPSAAGSTVTPPSSIQPQPPPAMAQRLPALCSASTFALSSSSDALARRCSLSSSLTATLFLLCPHDHSSSNSFCTLRPPVQAGILPLLLPLRCRLVLPRPQKSQQHRLTVPPGLEVVHRLDPAEEPVLESPSPPLCRLVNCTPGYYMASPPLQHVRWQRGKFDLEQPVSVYMTVQTAWIEALWSS